MLQQTPQQLIDILSISNKKFNDHKELTNYVSENSRLFKIPYSAYLTGSNRKTQKFCCRYGGRTYGINSAKTNCQSYICYTLDSNGKCSICEFNWFHNHSLEPEFTEAHCNCLPRSTKLKIQEFQRLCVSPGSIRCSLNIAINPNIFYNIRREVIRAQKIENVAKILNDTIEKLNSEQVEINKGMPLTFALRGRISNHPANNVVMGGRPKTQKSYCCSICRQPGHNKNHCPNK